MVWPFQYQWHQKQKHASSSDLSIAMQTYSCCKTRLQRRWRKACSFKSSLWKLSPWVWQDFFFGLLWHSLLTSRLEFSLLWHMQMVVLLKLLDSVLAFYLKRYEYTILRVNLVKFHPLDFECVFYKTNTVTIKIRTCSISYQPVWLEMSAPYYLHSRRCHWKLFLHAQRRPLYLLTCKTSALLVTSIFVKW